MAERTVPVAVHMWFRDGDGWAYHPNLKDLLQLAVKAVAKYLKFSETRKEFVLRHSHGILVGETAPDYDCKDAKALNRSPFILRVAYLKGVTLDDAATLEFVREGLRHLHLPTEQGPCTSLEISLAVAPQPMVSSMSSGPVRVHADRRERATDNAQDIRAAHKASHDQDLQERLRLAHREINALAEDRDRLEVRFDWAKSLVRSAKKALLVTLLVGVFHLLWWLFGDRGLFELVLGIVVTACASAGLYSTRRIKIYRWLV